jgi:cohesin loading factor subunit SCC2
MLTMVQDGVNVALNGSPTSPNSQPLDNVDVMRSSVIISMTMLLKAHLKSLYALSEE